MNDYVLDYNNLSESIRDPPLVPTDEVRRNFRFNEFNFYDAVVMPWYRSSDQFTYYYVADVSAFIIAYSADFC